MVYQILDNGTWKNTTKAKYDAQFLIDPTTVQILQPSPQNGGDLKTNRTLNGVTVSMPVFWDLSLIEGDLLTYQENKDKVIADKDTRDFETELAILGKGLASFTASSGNVQIAVSFSELADMRAKMVKDKADADKARKARYV